MTRLCLAAVGLIVLASGCMHRTVMPESAEEVFLAPAPLDFSGWSIYRGNRLASQGNWEQASRHWQEVLAADPQDDAALFNLGLASEAAGDFRKARRFYVAAFAGKRRGLYRESIDRVDRAVRDHQLAVLLQTDVPSHDATPTWSAGSTDSSQGSPPPVAWPGGSRLVRLPPPEPSTWAADVRVASASYSPAPPQHGSLVDATWR